MALKKTGVQLVAEGDAAYMAVMMRAGQAAVAFGDATTAAGRSVAAYQQRIERLNTTIGLQARQMEIMQRGLQETVAAHGADSLAAQKQQLSIDKLSASMKNNQATADRLESEMGQLATAEDKAGTASSKLGDVMTGALRRAGELITNVFMQAGQAIVSGIGAAVDQAGDYEQAMNLFAATTGASADQMEQASQLAVALGGDLTLPATSAASAGQAMNALAQAGLSVDDAMAAAKGTLQLSAAGMIDEAHAAEITAAALNQFHLAGTEAGHVADLLAASISASGSKVEQTGQAVQQAGAAFAAAHVPIEDFVTLVNEMSKAGIKGSDAGTSLKTMLMRLQAPTDKAAFAMEDLGINVYDAQGAMLPMRDIIGQFSKSLSGLTQQQRDQAVVTIFGADAQRAANIVLAGGTDAYDAMRGAVTKGGAAADQAGAQMKGLKGTISGLQSQVETLSLEALQPLLPILTDAVGKAAAFAGSFVGQVGPAMKDVIAIVSDFGIPAIEGITAATAVYALTTLPQLIAQLALADTAWLANAAATAKSGAALAVIAVTVANVSKAWADFDAKLTTATNRLLEGKAFWQQSTQVLATYSQQSDVVKNALADQAHKLEDQRAALQATTEELGRQMLLQQSAGARASLYTKTIEDLKARQNEQAAAIAESSRALEGEIEGYAHLHDTDAIEDLRAMRKGHDDLTQSIHLTDEEIAQFQKDIDKAEKAAISSIENYVNTAIKFNDDLTEAVKSGNAEQAKAVAANYAEQAAAAKAALGQQLIDYTIAWGRMNGVSEETLRATVGQIEKQFGQVGSISATTMLDMEGSIRDAMTKGGEAVSGLGTKLSDTTDKAIDLKEKANALEKKYVMEVYENFTDGKIDAEELRKELEKIPAKVYSEVTVTTTYKTVGEPPTQHGGPQASGGPVKKGVQYTVGEHGKEEFVPWTNGYIIPHHQIGAGHNTPPASPSQIIAPQPQVIIMQPANTQNYYGQVGNNYATQGRSGLSFDHMAALWGGRG